MEIVQIVVIRDTDIFSLLEAAYKSKATPVAQDCKTTMYLQYWTRSVIFVIYNFAYCPWQVHQ